MSGYSPGNLSLINIVTIMGLDESPSDVMLNDQPLMKSEEWEWDNDTMVSYVIYSWLLLLRCYRSSLYTLIFLTLINLSFYSGINNAPQFICL